MDGEDCKRAKAMLPTIEAKTNETLIKEGKEGNFKLIKNDKPVQGLMVTMNFNYWFCWFEVIFKDGSRESTIFPETKPKIYRMDFTAAK